MRLRKNKADTYLIQIALIICLCLSITIVQAAKIEQSVQKPDSLHLGDRFYLNITSDVELSDVVVPDTLTKFTIVEKHKIKDKAAKGGLRLVITSLDTGEHTFPALIVKPKQSLNDSLKTSAFTLSISELRAEKDSLLMDIAPTHKLKGELPYWAYYLILGLVIAALLVILFLWWKKHRQKKDLQAITEPAVIDERPNWKKALDALYELKEENLPNQGEFVQYHYRLSEIMKLYLESEYQFYANEMTTKEIKMFLKKHNPFSITEQRIVIDWLESCDKVKFAQYLPNIRECDEKLDWMVSWLMQHSNPKPADKPEAQDGN